MSVSVYQMAREWVNLYGWSHGEKSFPTALTTPSITEVERGLWDGELLVLERLPEWKQTEGTFSTTAGTAFYSNITDIMDRRILNVELTLSSGDEITLIYKDHTQLARDNPGWDDADETGTPTHYTIRPEDSKIGLFPVPDSDYTIAVLYDQQPKKFALPNDEKYFINGESIPATGGNETTINAVDMVNTQSDVPRKLLMTQWVTSGSSQADGAMTAVGTVVVSNIEIEDRTEALDWGDDSAAGSGDLSTYTYQMSTTAYFKSLDSITIGVEAASNSNTCSVGIGAFDTTVYTSNSHLPDNYALLIGPLHMAYLWAKMSDDPERANKFERDRDVAIERLIKAYSRPPNSRLFAYGRGPNGRRKAAWK